MHTTLHTLMIATLLLIFGVGVGYGQESQVVSITIFGDATLDEVFLTDFENTLAEYDTGLVFTPPGEQSPDNTIMSIQVDSTTSEIILVTYARGGHFVDISPLLQSSVVVIAQAPDENTNSLMIALVLYATSRIDEAESMLLELSEDEDTLYYNTVQLLLGNIQLINEDYEEALDYYEPLDRNLVRENLVWLYHHLGRADEAYELLNYDIDRLRGGSDERLIPHYLTIRARLFALDFDYDSAIADMDEAIEIAEEYDLFYLALARLYTTRGEIIFLIYEWDRVEDNFNMAIELDPTYAPAYFQRGVLFYTMARREDAQADFEQYLELEPDGIYAEQVQEYIDSIEIELDALGG